MKGGVLCAALMISLHQAEVRATPNETIKEGVERAQGEARRQAAGMEVEKAVEASKKTAKSLHLSENTHVAEGQKAAQQTAEQFNSPAFQDQLHCQQAKIEGSQTGRKDRETFRQAGKLTASESVYLFLSSSMPETAVNRYLIDLARANDSKMSPVMLGLPQGIRDRSGSARYFNQVTKGELSCQDKPGNACQRLQISIRINSTLFSQYGITQVPTLVYDNGQQSWAIQGDADLAYLLEKIGKEANSPALAHLSASIRGAH